MEGGGAPAAAAAAAGRGGYSALDSQGVAMGCFILARCLQLGQAVSKNEHKAQEYFSKVYTLLI